MAHSPQPSASTSSSAAAAAGTSTSGSLLSNPRGIPKAEFIDEVDDYVAQSNPEQALQALQQTLASVQQLCTDRRQGLDEKVPELQRTLAMVETLQRKKEAEESFDTTFELSDTLYATGHVDKVEEVFIWLGANTMLSYPLPAAISLLSSKLSAAESSLKYVREDLLWLREQITVTEVNVARVFNWDVKRRREERIMNEAKA